MLNTIDPITERRMLAHAKRVYLEEEIREKWAWRSWYRRIAREMFGTRWDDLEAANTAEIGRLVTELRKARAYR